jgi:hypothetical protein
MSNRIALLLFSSALLASCGKASVIDISDTDSPTALYVEDSTIQFTDPTLKERYVTIEDSIGFYVEKLDDIEQMYYTSDLGNEEFMQLSITGLGLQEKLTFFLKSSIEENIENPLGIYLLAVYGELFTADELHSLIQRIPPYPAYKSNNPFYEIIMQTTKGVEK